MTDELETLAAGWRIDRDSFARDVAEMRTTLESGLVEGADAAGRGIETALRRAARTGRIEFEDLARVAGRALGEIAAAALKVDAGAGLGAALAGAGAGLLGLPGRATGGPVTGGRAYVVGESGPELFVPTSAGRVERTGDARSSRAVQVTVNVAAPREAGAGFMQETGQQVARSVRRALARAGA